MKTWYIVYYGPTKGETVTKYGSTDDTETRDRWTSKLEARGHVVDVDRVSLSDDADGAAVDRALERAREIARGDK